MQAWPSSGHLLGSEAALVPLVSLAWPAEPAEASLSAAAEEVLRARFLLVEPCWPGPPVGGAGALSTLPGAVPAALGLPSPLSAKIKIQMCISLQAVAASISAGSHGCSKSCEIGFLI